MQLKDISGFCNYMLYRVILETEAYSLGVRTEIPKQILTLKLVEYSGCIPQSRFRKYEETAVVARVCLDDIFNNCAVLIPFVTQILCYIPNSPYILIEAVGEIPG